MELVRRGASLQEIVEASGIEDIDEDLMPLHMSALSKISRVLNLLQEERITLIEARDLLIGGFTRVLADACRIQRRRREEEAAYLRAGIDPDELVEILLERFQELEKHGLLFEGASKDLVSQVLEALRDRGKLS